MPEAPPQDAAKVVWQENGRRMQAWTTFDEIAVFRGRARDKADPEIFRQQMRGTAPKRDILTMTPFVSMIRTQKLDASRFASRRGMDTLVRRTPEAPPRPVSPVFYTTGRRDARAGMALTGEVVTTFAQQPTPAQLEDIERRFNVSLARSVTPRSFIFETETPWQSLQAANELNRSGLVAEASPHWLKLKARRLTNDPLSPQQWHLSNTGQLGGTPGADGNVLPVWEGFTGNASHVVAIVDGAVEIGHEDLQANVRPGLSYDFVSDEADPADASDDPHGTACAGIAAARGFNGLGVIGAAPETGLAGLRLLGAETDFNEFQAFSRNSTAISVYSNSWGPEDDGMRLEGPGPLALEAIQSATAHGRDGKGCVIVWAGGNGRQDLDNSNYDGYANLRQVIAVAASTDRGEQAPYSEPGANILLNAPSDGGVADITTTDQTGQTGYSFSEYTSLFGGTSAAAPLVSGVAALMLEANPQLSWRDVRWILAATARQNDPSHADWTVNGAGMHVNHAYGFGTVDAKAAVDASAGWPGLGLERTVMAETRPGALIPDNSGTGASSTLRIADDIVVEHVDIWFSAADHTRWGDLEITLTSPAGTTSVLSQLHPSGGTYVYDNWRFGSVRHLGERSAGDWTLTARDRRSGQTGTFEHWKLEIHGHDAPGGPGRVDITPALMLLLQD